MRVLLPWSSVLGIIKARVLGLLVPGPFAGLQFAEEFCLMKSSRDKLMTL